MIRIALKASSDLVRAGLRGLLSGAEDVRLTDDAEADVLITDLPAEAQEAGVPVLLLLPDYDRDSAATALRNGAQGVLRVNAPSEVLLAAVRALTSGLAVAEAEAAAELVPATRPSSPVEALTPREVEVLEMLAEGLANKQIAARLNISDSTVKFHVASILAKLHAQSRTEAVSQGLRLGLVRL